MGAEREYDEGVTSLAESALAQPAESREGFLQFACDGYPDLIRDVEQRLRELSEDDATSRP